MMFCKSILGICDFRFFHHLLPTYLVFNIVDYNDHCILCKSFIQSIHKLFVLYFNVFLVASLLSCLYQLKAENHTLEENIATLTARRDHLLAVNARLSVPLAIPVIPAGSQHPPTTPTSVGHSVSVGSDPDSSMILHPAHNTSAVHDNGVFEDGPQQSKHSKTAKSNSTASNFTLLRVSPNVRDLSNK